MDFEIYAPILVYIGVQALSIMFPQIAWILAPFKVSKDKLIKDALINGIEQYSDYTGDNALKQVVQKVAQDLEVDKSLHKEVQSRGLSSHKIKMVIK